MMPDRGNRSLPLRQWRWQSAQREGAGFENTLCLAAPTILHLAFVHTAFAKVNGRLSR